MLPRLMASRALLDGTHVVLTPEYVEFDFVLAGLYSRFLAWLIDTLITAVGAFFLILVLTMVLSAFPGFASALASLLWFAVYWGYCIVLELVWSGQTIGKRALGIRVVQDTGVRIGFQHAALRNLVRPLDYLPLFYFVGGAAALISESHQRLGDMLAGTIVVRERRLKIPSSLEKDAQDPQLLADPQFLAAVDKLSREEQELVLSAAMRREELGMDARLKLFAALSSRLQEEVGVYKPEHLSDEKVVLIAATALARKRALKRRAPAARQK